MPGEPLRWEDVNVPPIALRAMNGDILAIRVHAMTMPEPDYEGSHWASAFVTFQAAGVVRPQGDFLTMTDEPLVLADFLSRALLDGPRADRTITFFDDLVVMKIVRESNGSWRFLARDARTGDWPRNLEDVELEMDEAAIRDAVVEARMAAAQMTQAGD